MAPRLGNRRRDTRNVLLVGAATHSEKFRCWWVGPLGVLEKGLEVSCLLLHVFFERGFMAFGQLSSGISTTACLKTDIGHFNRNFRCSL